MIRIACAALLGILAAACVLGAAYAVLSIWNYWPPDVCVYCVPMVIASILAACGWWAVSRKWDRRKFYRIASVTFLGLVVCGLAVLAVNCAYIWRMGVGGYDSDSESVPLVQINRRLKESPGVQLPAHATEIHVMITGWMDSMTVLRFTAPKDEAQLFQQQVLAHAFGPAATGQVGQFPARCLHVDKDWWTPRPERAWFYNGVNCFFQFDEEANCLYLMAW